MDQTDNTSEDKLGVYPTQYHVSALETKRARITARAFAIGLYISLALNLALTSVLFMLTPLKTVEPLLVTFNDKNEQVVRIEPFRRDMPGILLFTEKSIQEYVKIREEIVASDDEMIERWAKYVYKRSTPDIFNEFRREYSPIWQQYRSRRLVRQVDIQTINRVGNSFLVEYKARDVDRNGRVIDEKDWTATVVVRYIPRQVDYNERYVNPLGFTVIDYSTARKGTGNETE